jgi:tRNA nucleotidyltransferase/poly(A) polymerase
MTNQKTTDHQLFEVGGCVRDDLLGVFTKDIDFTFVLNDTTQTVDQGWDHMVDFLRINNFKIFLETKDCFTIRAMFPKGHTHEGLVADFVMARKEVGYVPGTRKPILELGTLWDDLIRRDFTVNAMARDLDGNLIDPFGGQVHLEGGYLVTPLEPRKTFIDDPLRVLRALRFHITKDFTISDKVWDAMFDPEVIDKLRTVVSQDRIQHELHRMFQHDTVATLRLLAKIDKIDPQLFHIMFDGSLWLMPTTKQK